VLPGIPLKGQVSSISTIPDAKAVGTTSYIVKITFNVPQGLEVKPGMNAGVKILSSERKNVLLVSSEAVKRDKQGNAYVQVVNNQQIKDQPVVIGARDAVNTEIVSGLKEGDQVVTGLSWSLQ
jgi:multidrug efflux pump subunit AcrA (membrane-fusion protein)